MSAPPSTLRRLRGAVTAPRAAGVAGILSALLLTAVILLLRSGLGAPPTLELLTAGSSTNSRTTGPDAAAAARAG